MGKTKAGIVTKKATVAKAYNDGSHLVEFNAKNSKGVEKTYKVYCHKDFCEAEGEEGAEMILELRLR